MHVCLLVIAAQLLQLLQYLKPERHDGIDLGQTATNTRRVGWAKLVDEAPWCSVPN